MDNIVYVVMYSPDNGENYIDDAYATPGLADEAVKQILNANPHITAHWIPLSVKTEVQTDAP